MGLSSLEKGIVNRDASSSSVYSDVIRVYEKTNKHMITESYKNIPSECLLFSSKETKQDL